MLPSQYLLYEVERGSSKRLLFGGLLCVFGGTTRCAVKLRSGKSFNSSCVTGVRRERKTFRSTAVAMHTPKNSSSTVCKREDIIHNTQDNLYIPMLHVSA